MFGSAGSVFSYLMAFTSFGVCLIIFISGIYLLFTDAPFQVVKEVKMTEEEWKEYCETCSRELDKIALRKLKENNSKEAVSFRYYISS